MSTYDDGDKRKQRLFRGRCSFSRSENLAVAFRSVERIYLITGSINRALRDCIHTTADIHTYNSPLIPHIERCRAALHAHNASSPGAVHKPKLLLETSASLWAALARTPNFAAWRTAQVELATNRLLRFLDPLIPHRDLPRCRPATRALVAESFALELRPKQRAFAYVRDYDRLGAGVRAGSALVCSGGEGVGWVKFGVIPLVVQRDYRVGREGGVGVEVETVCVSRVVGTARGAPTRW
ncbi:MAG: hypothetical protein Q9165_002607 [Trypethelium subeluteriae]